MVKYINVYTLYDIIFQKNRYCNLDYLHMFFKYINVYGRCYVSADTSVEDFISCKITLDT